MTRATSAPALALASVIGLAVSPAIAQVSYSIPQVTYIPQGNPIVSKTTETRWVQTSDTVDVPGERQLVSVTPSTEKTVTGPTTRVVKEVETRTYSTPVTAYFVDREEARDVTTTTQNYIRRTSTTVLDKTWNVWMVGGTLARGYPMHAGVISAGMPSTGNFRDASWPYLTGGRYEISQDAYNRGNALAIQIFPHTGDYLTTYLLFDKKTFKFIGGNIVCCAHRRANVNHAVLRRYAGYDEIEYQLNCYKNEDWNPFSFCPTDRTTWVLRVNGPILSQETRYAYRTQTTDSPYSTTSTAYGSWNPTGKTRTSSVISARKPGTTYTETIVISQRTVQNSDNTPRQLAEAGQKQRGAFTSDNSSSTARASITGTQVRQSLKADQAKPSDISVSPRAADAARGQDTWLFPRYPHAVPARMRFEEYRLKR